MQKSNFYIAKKYIANVQICQLGIYVCVGVYNTNMWV